jgi:hypothetical protein
MPSRRRRQQRLLVRLAHKGDELDDRLASGL